MTVAEIITGSHDVRTEARLLTAFAEGDDPDGVELAIVDGEITLDGTADIRGSGDLTTTATFGQDGPSAWPRGLDQSFNPLTGNEVFLRYGVGSPIVWTPLGYYRFTVAEQDDATLGPVALTLHDRMATIKDSELPQPRVYEAGSTVESVFEDLVLEIYPAATISFDDASGSATLGRQLVIERSRYQGLYDIATGLGKIMFWNRQGQLRIETAPDEDEIMWEVNAGRRGVLVSPKRMISREGVYNGWVVRGEGFDETAQAFGVAVDANPNSLTFWGGRFGKIPRFFSSPFITNDTQAGTAAMNGLARTLGAPYNVEFIAVTNSELEPNQAIRLTYDDANRDIHVIQSLTIPLLAGPMSAATREQLVAAVLGGSL